MTKKKISIKVDPQVQVQILKSAEGIARQMIISGASLGDRVIQASLGSPYYSWAAITLLSAMGTRAKLWSPYTSDLVTGTGLALLGASEVLEAIPILSGLSGTEKMIDNKWDKSKVLSPWPIEVVDQESMAWLKNIGELQ
jgi:hypothetical protein